jgi:hypothetical protein
MRFRAIIFSLSVTRVSQFRLRPGCIILQEGSIGAPRGAPWGDTEAEEVEEAKEVEEEGSR